MSLHSNFKTKTKKPEQVPPFALTGATAHLTILKNDLFGGYTQ